MDNLEYKSELESESKPNPIEFKPIENRPGSIEIEDILNPLWISDMSEENKDKCFKFLDEYYYGAKTPDKIVKDFMNFQRFNNFGNKIYKFGTLIHCYKMGRYTKRYEKPNKNLERVLKVKNVRENSGVTVFSIFTSGYPSYTKINPDGSTTIVKDFPDDNSGNAGKYSCKYDCYYCPNYPDMPRSYLPGEPSVDRAISCNFEVFKMIVERAKQYIQQGHIIDKADVIIQGGTWDTYSIEYRTEFIRDVYYTFNVLMDVIFSNPIRKPLDMESEIKLNETSSCRIVGLTPETRPDQINYQTIRFLRKIGATRVQLGIQHTDDKILRHINRRCYLKDTIRAIKLLKDCGFKVAGHLMPDNAYPPEYEGKMPEIDRKMFEEFINNPDLKIDYVKIYPTAVLPHTKIKEWYEAGTFKPYGELIKYTTEEKLAHRKLSKKEKMELRLQNPLYRNIFDFYKSIHPPMRIERVFRDIPTKVICGGTTHCNLRSDMDNDLDFLGELSNCIRYREIGNSRNKNRKDIGKPIFKQIVFEGSNGTEYFLTYESDDAKPVLFAFARLRLSKNAGKTDQDKVIFEDLVDCALIREVHTYGKVTPCKENEKYYQDNDILFSQETNITQHKGFGKKLINQAEQIAYSNGFKKIAVIAGVGVREYYRKLGYSYDSIEGCYQIKSLNYLDKDQIIKHNNLKISKILIGLGIILIFISWVLKKLL